LKAKGLGGFEIEDKLDFGRLENRQIGGLCTLENASYVGASL
jgi:hypothetical protein